MSSEKPTAVVVVVGAGVIGLTTAIKVLETIPHVHCYILASCMPGDNKTIEYTSPWAASSFDPFIVEIDKANKPCRELIMYHTHQKQNPNLQAPFEKETFQILMDELEKKTTSALMPIDQYEHYTEGTDNGSNPEGLKLCGMPGLRNLRPDELPEGFSNGLTFRTLTIDTPAYLDYLAGRFKQLGGQLHRAKIASLGDVTQELRLQHPPSVIANCTGLGSLTLADVKDDALYPTRGQLCVIRAPWIKYGKTFTGKGTTSYTIPRSSGLVVVGGTRDYDDWYDKPRSETTKVILERALGFDRNLLPPDKRANGTIEDIDLVETGCGRRPSRRGGVRLELVRTGPTPIVHNYGHSGFGWQSSWGFARKASGLVQEALST